MGKNISLASLKRLKILILVHIALVRLTGYKLIVGIECLELTYLLIGVGAGFSREKTSKKNLSGFPHPFFRGSFLK